MSIQRKLFNSLIKEFNFAELFIELGWDKASITQRIKANDETYEIVAAAQKRGFVIFVCNSNLPAGQAGQENRIPNKDERKKIDRAVTKLYYEHLIIYTDKNKTQQLWQLSIQEANKPIQYREFNYYTKNEPEQLFEKLHHLFFTLDDEDKIALVDVKSKVTEQFNQNAEKVTKKFYAEFKKHHTSFQSFIEGLESQMEIDWYTSLMLNRLMFIYFIQKKGFLDSNTNYLSDKLKLTKNKKGNDKFYKSFYKTFLLTLFHQGLGKPNHTKEFENELGKIPYLNGGLFDVHKLEKDNDKLDIPDKAFEKLFAFFDEYNWHLDIKPTTTGKDINPDVIGYIFEKYINDRAAMGAYYTKEDITEYISKNTIIPFLFDRVKEKVKNAFSNESSLWQMLKENPNRYIYDAVSKGINTVSHTERSRSMNEETKTDNYLLINEKVADGLPDYITIGIDTTKPNLLERRKRWNEKTDDEFALPTEIWRETIERRKRYWELRAKIENDEIREINDFITHNLNIRQFAQDAVEQYEGSDFINAFYKAITEITILDPTCGSGAFLFAALNILEPLYEACIYRMREFVEADNELGTGKKHENFRKVLTDIKLHANEKYYIFKSIILNNLYGVDIMNEAVEIAKLRLFLKLVAVVTPNEKIENYGLEPLPDIDFNIRAGNTLVGFASYKDIENAIEEKEAGGSFVFSDERKAIQKADDDANIVGDLYREFKKQQTINDANSAEYKKTKQQVVERLQNLNDSLNKLLANQYNVDENNKKKYEAFLTSHKPFHWFAEFYEIVHQNGGFDVVIGNPPYVEYKNVDYQVNSYTTESCSNLYAFVVEKNESILNTLSKTGMIIPHSAFCTDRMTNLMNLFKDTNVWVSFFDIRPAGLFSGVDQRLAVYIKDQNNKCILYTSKYNRWHQEFREYLFNNISFASNHFNYENAYPKLGSYIEDRFVVKMCNNKILSNYFGVGQNIFYKNIFYHNSPRYWIRAMNYEPYFWNERDGQKLSSQIKLLSFTNAKIKNAVLLLINSNLFYWWFNLLSDSRHLNNREIERFPFNIDNFNIKNEHALLVNNLMEDYEKNKVRKETNYKTTGNVIYDEYYPRFSKSIIDEIDKVLAKHYGFTEEELDFIINYDIKYRMGKELNDGE
ncbi:MAG: Eco57I restriction-modification methylase domain-containing protein [Ignavibacteriaceae bacterium]|nr:Eco57I restriction-modification methylase domain-containing protein [Ignavibacteriaceae bacterium]